MQTGTIFSGIGHAGVILWVLIGDWLFQPSPAEEVMVVTSVSMMTSAEFEALQAASTPTPSEVPAPVRPAPRPEVVVEVPEPEPEPAPEPIPEAVAVAETEQVLPSESTEIQPNPEAEEIIAPDPLQPETEAETSDMPEPAVSEEMAQEATPLEPTEATVPEDTGDVTQTEANIEDTAETGMVTSPRPRTRPEVRVEPEVEVAAVEVPAAEPVAQQPVDDRATEDAIAALLGEAIEQPVQQTTATAGQALPQGPPLTGGETSNISSAIARRFNLGAASTDVMSTMVVIRVSFSADGTPTSIELIESNGPTQAAVSNLFSIASRAVNRTHLEGGIPLPPEKYETWRVLDFVFDASGMRVR